MCPAHVSQAALRVWNRAGIWRGGEGTTRAPSQPACAGHTPLSFHPRLYVPSMSQALKGDTAYPGQNDEDEVGLTKRGRWTPRRSQGAAH